MSGWHCLIFTPTKSETVLTVSVPKKDQTTQKEKKEWDNTKQHSNVQSRPLVQATDGYLT